MGRVANAISDITTGGKNSTIRFGAFISFQQYNKMFPLQ